MPRILVIDGSLASRRLLRQALEAERDIEIIGELGELGEALPVVHSAAPDLIAIDAAALRSGGLLTITRIMAEAPRPIIVLSELVHDPNDEFLRQAIHRGALAVQAKPTLSDLVGAAALRSAVRSLAKVPVVRHLGRRLRPPAPSSSPMVAGEPPISPRQSLGKAEVIGIGASAGGPAVLAQILGELPADFSLCILVVQHLPLGFARPFAEFLRSHIALPVAVATPQLALAPGLVILAADGQHLVLADRAQVGSSAAPPLNGHRPAVDLLFQSMAQIYGAASIGIVLSGIGSDGTNGLRTIRDAGGHTIAQAGDSAAVNGMPRSASESGAAQYCLHPLAIAALLRSHFAPAKDSHGG